MAVLSNRINLLSESETIRMAKLSRELIAEGIDVISLSFGEPDFPTPDYIKTAAKKAMDDNWTYYTPVAGYVELRNAIADKLKRENNLEYVCEQIVVSTGAKQALANAVMCLVNPGDEVIVPMPYWVSYSEMIKLAEGKSVCVATSFDNNFKITPEQLEAAITPKTKLFMFSSPCNPTGSVYSREELAALVQVFEKHPNIYILADEIYEHINFIDKHTSIAEFPSVKERVVLVNGFSKAFAMTGWRIGYLAANKEIAKACDKMQGQFTSATCSIAQRAGIAALDGGLDTVNKMKAEFLKRRDLVYDLLRKIPDLRINLPDGAFYFFPDVSAYYGKETTDGKIISNSTELCLYLLEKHHVGVVPGDAFGDGNCIRLSYATSEERLFEAIKRLHKGFESLIN